jgi:hypothetical protein
MTSAGLDDLGGSCEPNAVAAVPNCRSHDSEARPTWKWDELRSSLARDKLTVAVSVAKAAVLPRLGIWTKPGGRAASFCDTGFVSEHPPGHAGRG